VLAACAEFLEESVTDAQQDARCAASHCTGEPLEHQANAKISAINAAPPAQIAITSRSRLSSLGLFIWLYGFLHGAEGALEQIVISPGAAELLQCLGEYFETLLGSYRVHV
jgi:hypothetical protein